MARKLIVEIVGDSSSLEKSFKRSSASANRFGHDIGRVGRGSIAASGVFQSLGRSVAFASAGFLGGFGLVAAIKAGFDEMSSMQKVAAQTAAVIKSTGGVAGVTATHVDELSKSLLNISGVDDELIKNSENLLLTFTNIRNVVGKGNDIFDRATKAALNLSVRFDKDLAQSAVLVGKALQDPVRGLTSLQRVGVQFSKSQRETIKNLVESGHVLEAQKVVLGELEVQTKGAAAAAGDTLGGKLARLRETVRNVAGSIAEQMLPAITKVVDRALAWVTNLENQQRVMNDVKQVAQAVSDAFNVLRSGFEDLNKITGSTKRTVELLFGALFAFKTLKLIGVLAGIASNVGLIGTNARTATGETVGLRRALTKLRNIGPIVIGVTVALAITGDPTFEKFRKKAADKAGPFDRLLGNLDPHSPGFVGKKFASDTKAMGDAIVASVKPQAGKGLDPLVTRLFKAIFPDKKAKVDPDAVENTRKAVGNAFGAAWSQVLKIQGEFAKRPGDVPRVSRAQSNALFDSRVARLIDRVQDAPIKGQVRKLQRIAELIQQRIDATKGVTRKLELEDKLVEVTRQERAARQAIVQAFLDRLQFNVDKTAATKNVDDDIAALQKLNAALAKRIKAGGDTLALEQKQFDVQQQILALRKQQADARKAARTARQFGILGFGPTGEDLVPGVKTLKRQLASVTDAIEGSFLDTGKTRSRLNSIRRVLADGVGHISNDVRAKIKQLLDDLKAQLKKSSVDVTRFNKTARGQFVLAGASPGGTGNVTIQGGIHLHGVQNVQQMEEALAKRRKQRAHARRGTR